LKEKSMSYLKAT